MALTLKNLSKSKISWQTFELFFYKWCIRKISLAQGEQVFHKGIQWGLNWSVTSTAQHWPFPAYLYLHGISRQHGWHSLAKQDYFLSTGNPLNIRQYSQEISRKHFLPCCNNISQWKPSHKTFSDSRLGSFKQFPMEQDLWTPPFRSHLLCWSQMTDK